MFKKIKRVVLWLVALLLLTATCWFAYEGYSAWKGATDTVKAAIIAALVSAVIFALTKYFEQKEIYRLRIVKEKTDAYLKVIDILFDIFKPEAIKKGKKIDENKIASDLYEIKKEIMIWGSDSVIECWIKLLLMAESSAGKTNSSGESLAPIIHAIGELILSIRKDIGYSGTNIKEIDIAGLILKIDDVENQRLLGAMKEL